jgi:hypothetical protein
LAHWRTPGAFLGVCPRPPHRTIRTNVRYTKTPRETDLLSLSLRRYNRIMLRRCTSKWLSSDGRLQPCAPPRSRDTTPVRQIKRRVSLFRTGSRLRLADDWAAACLSHERARSLVRICVCACVRLCVRVLDKCKSEQKPDASDARGPRCWIRTLRERNTGWNVSCAANQPSPLRSSSSSVGWGGER